MQHVYLKKPVTCFRANIENLRSMELTKIKMSEAKVYYCSGWGVGYPRADSVL